MSKLAHSFTHRKHRKPQNAPLFTTRFLLRCLAGFSALLSRAASRQALLGKVLLGADGCFVLPLRKSSWNSGTAGAATMMECKEQNIKFMNSLTQVECEQDLWSSQIFGCRNSLRAEVYSMSPCDRALLVGVSETCVSTEKEPPCDWKLPSLLSDATCPESLGPRTERGPGPF